MISIEIGSQQIMILHYEVKKINFKTFERIVKENIRAAKREYYFKTFTAQKNDMKKTWKTIDETLNRRRNKSKFPSEFVINNRSIADHKEIADQFNIFFSNIGSTLSDSIKIDANTLDFTDYLNIPLNIASISTQLLKAKLYQLLTS